MASCVRIKALLSLSFLVSLVLGSDIVDLGYARYRGIKNTTLDLTTFYGLSYARAPTGELRWQSPQSIDSPGTSLGSDVINATVPGAQCPQFVPGWFSESLFGAFPAQGTPLPMSEDCLHLDVIVPNRPSSSDLPVLVQIHGGGYTFGNSLTYDGQQFTAAANGSLIWVQIQYRLGPYGFLSSDEIKANGTANAGLLDQREALEWVRRHIGAFGGDPDRVTIWGGSAGGGSVTSQLMLYGGSDPNPPFAAAIAEYPWWQPFRNDAMLETQFQSILNATSCGNLTCLRGLDSEVLTNASLEAFSASYQAGLFEFGDFYFGPSVDGQIIQNLPSNEYKQGHFSRVPLLIDHDAFEGVIFTNLSITSGELLSDLQTLWPNTASSPSFYARLLQLYPATSFNNTTYLSNPIFSNYSAIARTTSDGAIADPPTFYQRQTIFADAFVNCPTYFVATALVDAGMPVWKLFFAAGLEIHSATQSFLLSASDTQSPSEYALWMKDYFTSFIVANDPNASPAIEGKPEWPQYLSAGPALDEISFQVLQFNQTNVGVGLDMDVSGICDFWHGQSYNIRN